MGLVAGLLLGIGVALTREAADRTVRDRTKLEALSGLPTLAELPGHARRRTAVRHRHRRSTTLCAVCAPGCCRAMGPEGRRVLLAAPFGGEGTTTTAINLSPRVRRTRRRRAVDRGRYPPAGDRRIAESRIGGGTWRTRWPIPSIATRSSETDLDFEAVHPRGAFNPPRDPAVQRVPAGGARQGTAGLVGTAFDRIVVDGPPVLATADSGLLAGAVDATVLVVRAGRTTDDELNDALTASARGRRRRRRDRADRRPNAPHTRAAARTYRAKVSGPTVILYLPESLIAWRWPQSCWRSSLFGCFGSACCRFVTPRRATAGRLAMFCLVVYWVKPEAMVGVALFLGVRGAAGRACTSAKSFGPVVDLRLPCGAGAGDLFTCCPS